MSVTTAVLIVTVTGVLCAVLLVVAAKFMHVAEDPRVGEVTAALAGANCGACGYAGCADYAKAIVENGAPINLCTPGGATSLANVSAIMGVEGGALEKLKAVVICQGDNEKAKSKYAYEGVKSCAAASGLFGGDKACPFGCLGYGDCVLACKFDAIHVENGVAKVDQAKCTGCKACATVCPKKIIIMQKASDQPVVLCKNTFKGAVVRTQCTVGCIACTRCVRECPVNAIYMEDNLAHIDHEKCINCGKCIEVCPTHCIKAII